MVTFNIELEQTVLGGILLRNDTLAKIPDLFPAHFYEPFHGKIFEVIRDFWNRGEIANPVTLKPLVDSLPELGIISPQYLATLTAKSGFIGVDYARNCADGIIDLASRRAIAEACARTLAEIESCPFDLPTVGVIGRLKDELERRHTKTNIQSASEIIDEILNNNPLSATPIKTGFHKLDQALDGGMYRSNLHSFLGRPKAGKTLFMATLACNIAMSGHIVFYIAAEMGAKQIELRNLAWHLRMNPAMLRGEQTDDVKSRMKRWGDFIGDKLLYQDAPGINFAALKSAVEAAVYTRQAEVFVLDYWQLVKAEKASQNRTEHLDYVAQWLAEICKRHNIVGIVGGQTNREGEARFGDGLAMASDICMEICRPDDLTDTKRWLEMRQTRYTAWTDIGSKETPRFEIVGGSHIEEI